MVMKKSIAAFAAAAFILPATAMAGVCWTDAQCAREIADETTEAINKNMPYVQASISGFFNTLNVKKEQTKQGLTIDWTSSTSQQLGPGINVWVPAYDFGHAVATGKFNAQGCPEFDVSVMKRLGNQLHATPARKLSLTRAICP